MSINIIPPDPRAIENARKERLFVFSLLGILASGAVFVYLAGTGVACYHSSDNTFYAGCLNSFHPLWAAIVGSISLFIISLASAINYAND